MSDTATRLTAALADRYRVTHELGAGGMATVYLAHEFKVQGVRVVETPFNDSDPLN